ncbi:unnamed protein product [Fusarium venenatum]|uniref:Uncharacterized protein n=1 Tax=Fusarium venenatum TaxID=56646 RepID=A0A2L2T0T8_9HYPO|nr:uncharacterized protein FVRRES_12274 [Fusarium venenatum]CEI39583.1 unnamed protein product [Fusarium venenatum]
MFVISHDVLDREHARSHVLPPNSTSRGNPRHSSVTRTNRKAGLVCVVLIGLCCSQRHNGDPFLCHKRLFLTKIFYAPIEMICHYHNVSNRHRIRGRRIADTPNVSTSCVNTYLSKTQGA